VMDWCNRSILGRAGRRGPSSVGARGLELGHAQEATRTSRDNEQQELARVLDELDVPSVLASVCREDWPSAFVTTHDDGYVLQYDSLIAQPLTLRKTRKMRIGFGKVNRNIRTGLFFLKPFRRSIIVTCRRSVPGIRWWRFDTTRVRYVIESEGITLSPDSGKKECIHLGWSDPVYSLGETPLYEARAHVESAIHTLVEYIHGLEIDEQKHIDQLQSRGVLYDSPEAAHRAFLARRQITDGVVNVHNISD
jgi:hypothetical protein